MKTILLITIGLISLNILTGCATKSANGNQVNPSGYFSTPVYPPAYDYSMQYNRPEVESHFGGGHR